MNTSTTKLKIRRPLIGLLLTLTAGLCAPASIAATERTLRVCVDDRYWYPFSYIENDKGTQGSSRGIFVELTKAALARHNIYIDLRIMPIRRCINVFGKLGQIDAVIGVPYTRSGDSPAKLLFPANTTASAPSPWRLMQVDFNLVTSKNNAYAYKGQLATLPTPVRIPKANAHIIQQLTQAGIKAQLSKADDGTFYKLFRDHNGSLITTSIMADRFNEKPRYHNQFTVHSLPIASQAYFLAFFDTSATTPGLRQKIWQDIAMLRDDYVFMLQLLAQY